VQEGNRMKIGCKTKQMEFEILRRWIESFTDKFVSLNSHIHIEH